MDSFLWDSLEAWADRVLRDEERATVILAMVDLVESDPTLLELGWPAIRNATER